MRALVLGLEHVAVGSDWRSTVKYSSANIWHVFAETGVFILDLVSQFTGVAEYDDCYFTSDRFDLLKGSADENSGFTFVLRMSALLIKRQMGWLAHPFLI